MGIVDGFVLGHGIFTTTEKTMHTPKFDDTSRTLQPNTTNGECQRLIKQARRLDQAACLLSLLENDPTAAVQQRKEWERTYGMHLVAMAGDTVENNSEDV